jgi:hypothetical protein
MKETNSDDRIGVARKRAGGTSPLFFNSPSGRFFLPA